MTKSFPKSLSLSGLNYEAKQILKVLDAGDESPCEILQLHPKLAGKTNRQILAQNLTLQDVQHALALEYGFDSWSSLAHTIEDPRDTHGNSPSKDAFGEALREVHIEGSEEEVILERNDGAWSPHDLTLYFSDYEDWDELEHILIKKVMGRTVDIGCGAGRHSLYLQRQGIDVLAIDSSPGCVAVSADRGVMNTQLLGIEQIDQLQNPPYDSVLLMGSNLGLLGSKSTAKRILGALDSVTSDGARIVATTSEFPETDHPYQLAFYEYNRKRGRFRDTMTSRVKWREYVGDWFDFVLLSRDDLESAIDGSSWEVCERVISDGVPQVGYVICKRGDT